VVLGLSLTLVPPITVTKPKANIYSSIQMMPGQVSSGLEKIEGTYSPNADVGIFALSFVIALVAYLLLKYILPRHGYGTIRPYLY
jgi:hypothetical protein